MLPNPQNGPAQLVKTPIRVTVALLVGLDLIPPPCGISLRPGTMDRTAMPEAPIEKNSNARTWEGDIDTTLPIRYQAAVDSKS